MRRNLTLIIFGAILTMAFLVKPVAAAGPVKFFLQPSNGTLYAGGQDNIVEFRIDPQGEEVTGVEIQFQYLQDKITITDTEPNSELGVTKTEMQDSFEGGRYYLFTFPSNIVSQNTVIAKLHIRTVASSASGVDILLKGAKASTQGGSILTLNSGTVVQHAQYNIGAVPSPTSTPTPSPTPTPFPTPTPLPEKPSITFPESVGKDFVISSDPNSNRPEFRWNMMGNPAGSIKRMGLRVVKVSDNPGDTSGDFSTGCSDKVVIDRWWYSQTATDAQTHNRNQPDSATNLKICSDRGEGYSVSSEGKPADLLAQAFNLRNVASYAYRPETSLSPGKYFMTVFNFDNTYHSDANTLGSGSETSAASNFRSSYYFTVSCLASSPVWDGTGSRCITARPTQYALSEDLNDLSEGAINSHWASYSDTPTVVSHTFSNVTIGQVRTLFVRFKDEQGNINPPFNKPPISKSIKYLGSNPEISNVSCNFNSETGTGSKVVVTGSNFGSAQGKGGVKVLGSSGAANTTITSWGKVVIQPTREPVSQDNITGTVTPTGIVTGVPSISPTLALTPTTSPSSTITGVLGESTDLTGTPTITLSVTPTGVVSAQTQDRVAIRVKERLEGTVNIELMVNDGRKVTASCTVDTNTVSFATVTQCRPAGSFAEGNVRVQIYENTLNARPLYDSKVSPISISADGTPQWIPPPLEIGKTYNLIIKAPKSLAVKRAFTVSEGTNILDDVTFPVGDIAPANAPDGVINAVDKSELIRQWSATTDIARAGDFNMDGRINSLDYSCMRQNINRAADQFVKN